MAFKELGISRIIAPSAVGSLKEKIEPGHFALPTQFVDFTKSRIGSFSEEGRVIHISVADPFCPELQESIKKLYLVKKIIFTKIVPMYALKVQDFQRKQNQNSIEQLMQILLE